MMLCNNRCCQGFSQFSALSLEPDPLHLQRNYTFIDKFSLASLYEAVVRHLILFTRFLGVIGLIAKTEKADSHPQVCGCEIEFPFLPLVQI